MLEGLDLAPILQSAFGGAVGSSLTAALGLALFKSQESRIEDIKAAQVELNRSYEARMKAQEDGNQVCEQRYQILLTHVLSMKAEKS